MGATGATGAGRGEESGGGGAGRAAEELGVDGVQPLFLPSLSFMASAVED